MRMAKGASQDKEQDQDFRKKYTLAEIHSNKSFFVRWCIRWKDTAARTWTWTWKRTGADDRTIFKASSRLHEDEGPRTKGDGKGCDGGHHHDRCPPTNCPNMFGFCSWSPVLNSPSPSSMEDPPTHP
ncbi:uncharacterized protein Dana_GF26797 [Drosophila ananassae]|uniref:Uncharacterized protein n=1 Tax=Drosophila ananassae TaxID=7217 RepID=A0A0P9C1D6_DROAN|nr:uncharacterized protein Dana_GF26797 [Drosophila ananassae]